MLSLISQSIISQVHLIHGAFLPRALCTQYILLIHYSFNQQLVKMNEKSFMKSMWEFF